MCGYAPPVWRHRREQTGGWLAFAGRVGLPSEASQLSGQMQNLGRCVMVRYSSDPRLAELEQRMWGLRAQLDRLPPLQRRLAEAQLQRWREEYRAIPQGPAFEDADQSARDD